MKFNKAKITGGVNWLLSLTLLASTLLFNYAPAKAEGEPTSNIAETATSAVGEQRGEWTVAGPDGGDVRSLAIDPQNPQRLMFGTLDGQIYVTEDGGTGWSRLTSFNRPGLTVDNIIIDSRDSNTVYVSAHRHKESGGFFKSKDGGRSWRAASELKDEALHAMAQSPNDPNVLVVGTYRGVYRSDDSGETWRLLPVTATSPTKVDSLAIDPRTTNTMYAGTWYLPYKTTDGGQTWRVIKNGMIDDSDVFAVEIDDANPDHVIASACSGIYESRTAGESWRKVQGIPSTSRRTRAILQNPTVKSTIYAGTTEGFWRSNNGGDAWMLMTSKQLEINTIAVHPSTPDVVYIGTNNYGVMRSRDGGRTFELTNQGYSGRRAYAILPDRERPNRIYATTINTATGGGFFFVSNDNGMTWQPSTRNMPSRLIAFSILQDEQDANIIYLGTSMGIYRSSDRGASWSPIGTPKPAATTSTRTTRGRASSRGRGATSARRTTTTTTTTAVPQQTATTEIDTTKRAQEALTVAGYNVGTPDGVMGTRTTAAVRQFQSDRNIPQTGRLDEATLVALGITGGKQTPGDAQSARVAPLVTIENVNMLSSTRNPREGRSGMFAATNAGLFRTYDPSQGWERLSYGASFDPRTLCVSVNRQNPNTIYVGTATSGVLVSRDGGTSWQQVPTDQVPASAPINVIEQDPQRSAYVYVGTSSTFYMSHDGGERFQRRGGNLPLGSYTSILINPTNGDEIFAASAWERGEGVFYSNDAGKTWQRVDPDLPSRRVWALAFDPRDTNRIFVGSHSAGVYVVQRSGGALRAGRTN